MSLLPIPIPPILLPSRQLSTRSFHAYLRLRLLLLRNLQIHSYPPLHERMSSLLFTTESLPCHPPPPVIVYAPPRSVHQYPLTYLLPPPTPSSHQYPRAPLPIDTTPPPPTLLPPRPAPSVRILDQGPHRPAAASSSSARRLPSSLHGHHQDRDRRPPPPLPSSRMTPPLVPISSVSLQDGALSALDGWWARQANVYTLSPAADVPLTLRSMGLARRPSTRAFRGPARSRSLQFYVSLLPAL
ncbi:hypothetical protein R3P38DRAFT_3212835 [Favolaschia claudopus]|uniref:Uncharacterized protein n=1 Tax=Favolaschia claudopus TaxID=2862362 RepID=A0AAW0ADT7_9AGAR